MHFTSQVLTVLAASLLAATAAAAPKCHVGTAWPDPHDCHKFFECAAGGIPVRKTCGPGTAYSPKLRVCDYEQRVPSCHRHGKPDWQHDWSKDDKGNDKGKDQWAKNGNGKEKRQDLHSGWDDGDDHKHGQPYPHPSPWWNENLEGDRPQPEWPVDDDNSEEVNEETNEENNEETNENNQENDKKEENNEDNNEDSQSEHNEGGCNRASHKKGRQKESRNAKTRYSTVGLSISETDFEKLTAGFEPQDQDDKWRVVVSPLGENGIISVHFSRTGTGIPHYIFFIRPSDGGSSGARIEAITWEQNKGGIYIWEEMAKMTVVTISRSLLECDYDVLPLYNTDDIL